jgi:hypothetical protein
MKKHIFTFNILAIFLLLSFFISTSSCEKSSSDDYKKLLGTWISTDLVDTVEFTSDKDFYKMFSGVRDHFDYSLSRNKITICYNGMSFILVIPSTHPFELKGGQLTIDFRPSCYGFREQEITFIKK